MAKNKEKPVSDNSVVAEEKVEQKVSKKETKVKEAKDTKSKDTKTEKINSKSKPKKEKKSLKKKAQEVVSELKKVSKPSFGKVVKDTCVVIAVVSICTLFLFGIDKLFSLLNGLLLS